MGNVGRLKPGSVAVIASDGVITGDDDAWLREQLRDEPDDKDMRSLAREVLRKAADEYGAGRRRGGPRSAPPPC